MICSDGRVFAPLRRKKIKQAALWLVFSLPFKTLQDCDTVAMGGDGLCEGVPAPSQSPSPPMVSLEQTNSPNGKSLAVAILFN